jgi:hypothetical protein
MKNFKDMASLLMSFYGPQQRSNGGGWGGGAMQAQPQQQQLPQWAAPQQPHSYSMLNHGAGHNPLGRPTGWGPMLKKQINLGFEPGQRVDNPWLLRARGLG